MPKAFYDTNPKNLLQNNKKKINNSEGEKKKQLKDIEEDIPEEEMLMYIHRHLFKFTDHQGNAN